MVQLEGLDITAENMVLPDHDPSEIKKFYTGSTVFITGATGFLGKLIMEKLLRTCPDVEQVYILIRPKKGKDISKRFDEIFENVVFDRLKREHPKFLHKVSYMSGDCELPMLGLSEEDKHKIITEVNCIFHVAATVRFDEKIRTAVHINVRATKDILSIAKDAKQLRSVIYISTAFSNCTQKEIGEVFYDTNITGQKLMTVVDTLDDEMLEGITPVLLGKWPNTYAFTKAIAEEVIKAEGKGLPLAVVRPSIVIATVKEPAAGWIDNLYGATGVLMGAAVGLVRTLHCDPDKLADMVPADYVINTSIVAAWDVANAKSLNANKEITVNGFSNSEKFEDDIPIFNYVCSTQRPITWRDFMSLAERHATQIPSPLLLWHYCFRLNPNRFVHLLCVILLHRFPAYLVDFFAYCIGRKPMLVKGYQKIEKFLDVISYFSTRQWRFQNNNTQGLWKKLNYEDKKLFEFDMNCLDWDAYFYTYVRGARVYLLKDPMDTLPQGRIKALKLRIGHYTVVTIVCLILLKLFMIIYNCIF